jgi:hypothetical protein
VNFAFSLFGKVVATYAVLMLVFDGFGDELDGSDVTRLGAAAIGAALLALAARQRGGGPWGWGKQGKFGPHWADVAKHAIDVDAQTKRGASS